MKNFKNSKAVKIATGLLGLALTAMMIAPAMASAATTMMTTTTSTSCSYVFTMKLKMGVTDQEVFNLQKVLNMSADTQVAVSGAGSPGMETKYFGKATKAAVIKWQNMHAADVLTPAGLTAGTGLVGPASRAKLNMMCTGSSMTTTTTSSGSTSTVPGCMSLVGFSPTTGQACSAMTTGTTTTGGSISAMLDSTSAMAGSVIKGASTKVAVFKLTNNGSAAAKVTAVKMKRTGVSSDTTLKNVYLFSGDMRITDSASVATGNINFSDTSGIVTIPAMSSVMLGVMVEVDNTGTTNIGETLGVMLTDVTTDAGAVSGLPVSGAMQTVVAPPNGMATVQFSATTLPNSAANIDPQVDYVVWQNTVQIGSRDVLLTSLRFRQLGSVSAGDLKNFRLMVDGVMVGTPVASVSSNQYVEFTFATPVTLKAGGRTVKLLADIIGGSNKNFGFSVQQSVDAMFWDSQLNVVIAPALLPSTTSFGAVIATTQTVNQGTLTITKATDSPSGNIVLQGSGLTLGKFVLKAAGEKLKIENLRVSFSYVGAAATPKIRNGALFANGVQIGSTQDINSTSSTPFYTQYNLGSSLIVEPGTTVNLEVRGDVYNTGSVTAFAANETFIVNIATGVSNVYKMSSYGYFANSAIAANTMTIAAGTMTVAKATSYANQVVTVPQTAFKIGEFNVTTGSTEALNLNQFTVSFTGSTGDVTRLQDVYVVYGTKTTVVKSTVASTSNTFSVNENVLAGATMNVKVYATLNSNSFVTSTIVPTLQVDATSQASGNSTTGTVAGQTITVGTGSLTLVVDASTPIAALAVANSMPKIASYKFTASNDAFTIVDLTATTTNSAAVIELVFKDGATEIGRQPFNGAYATKTGLNVVVPANTNKVIDVYASLGSVGTNAAASGGNVALTVTSVKSRNSNGVETTTYYPAGVSGNAVYVYKTKPVITNVALPTTVLNNGTQSIYQFMVTADAGGTVAWRTVRFNVTLTTATIATTTYALYDSANQSTVLANTLCTFVTNVTCTSSTDQEVSGSKTYVLKATVAGAVVGTSVSVNIPSSVLAVAASTDAATVQLTAATFVWSDESITPHTAATFDWSNDSLVRNLPTDSLTMTK